MFKLMMMFGLTGTSTIVLLPDVLHRPACIAGAAIELAASGKGSAASCANVGAGTTAITILHGAQRFVQRVG